MGGFTWGEGSRKLVMRLDEYFKSSMTNHIIRLLC